MKGGAKKGKAKAQQKVQAKAKAKAKSKAQQKVGQEVHKVPQIPKRSRRFQKEKMPTRLHTSLRSYRQLQKNHQVQRPKVS
jgi:hypothetical protein